jgi:4a-hydroxytetrahydrobiopterin dehydratase
VHYLFSIFAEGVAMQDLASKTCVPCRGGVPPLKGGELNALAQQVPLWQVVNGHHLQRKFEFADFVQALAFVNRVGEIAEQQGHHPDILLAWGKAEVTTFTHKIDGLTESDFILAAKIDKLSRP